MNILHICKSDLRGGASRASFRINQSLNNNKELNINSKMRVINKISEDKNIISKKNIFHNHLYPKLISLTNKIYRLGYKTNNKVVHSTSILKTGLGRELSNFKLYKDIDIFHLHWLGDITLSIEEIGLLNKPVVWTLHDQWPFLGAEHYVRHNHKIDSNLIDQRYSLGYYPNTRFKDEIGFDINRKTWLRKRKAWSNKFHIVCPSLWMENCAKQSIIFKNNPIYTIPNPIDSKKWKPIEMNAARKKLGIPINKKIILFGALKAINDERKGANLLFDALKKLNLEINNSLRKKILIFVFGDDIKNNKLDLGFPLKFTGHINNDRILNLIYSAANVFVNPSIQESFGQTATEANCCGTPVVAFNSTGLIDIVDHLETGYLAEPFKTDSLANGIKWILENDNRNNILGINARKKAKNTWDSTIVSEMYADLYKNIIKIQ